jgi:hypothetical protein
VKVKCDARYLRDLLATRSPITLPEGVIPNSSGRTNKDEKQGSTENESEGSAAARLFLHHGDVQGTASVARIMTAVATAPPSVVTDPVKADKWPRLDWYMAGALYAV